MALQREATAFLSKQTDQSQAQAQILIQLTQKTLICLQNLLQNMLPPLLLLIMKILPLKL
jgi:hypothetical protein